MKKFLTTALLAGGLILSTAAPALAHSSNVTHQETCPEGVTKTVVTFDNDFNLTATVAYHWGSNSPSTVNLAAKTGTSKPTVSLASHAVGTLNYHITWSDTFRQPGQGESTLTIGPLTSCPPTTTTTKPPTTTTTKPPTTTTTKPPTTTSSSTTTTQLPPTTSSSTTTTQLRTTTSSSTTTTTTAQAGIVGTQVLGEQLVRPSVEGPTPVGGVQTGGGGMSNRGNHLLLLAVGLGCVGLITFVTKRLRRRAG